MHHRFAESTEEASLGQGRLPLMLDAAQVELVTLAALVDPLEQAESKDLMHFDRAPKTCRCYAA